MVVGRLKEKDYEIVDVLTRVARELNTTVPRAALAWVCSKPRVASTIIGARTIEQFDDDAQALELTLTPAQLGALDAVSLPQLPFRIPFLGMASAVYSGGTTINGETPQSSPIMPQRRGEHH